MADVNYFLPGSGIVMDTEEGSNPLFPGSGLYQEQVSVAPGGATPKNPLGHPIIGAFGGPIG